MTNFTTKTSARTVFTIASLTPFVVLAHGPQIQLSYDLATGKIITRSIVDTHAAQTTLSDPRSLYIMPLLGTAGSFVARPDPTLNVSTGLYAYAGPGISYQYDASNAPDGNLAGSGWSLSSLAGTTFTLNFRSGLQRWNGNAFADAGSTQLQVGATAITNDAGSGAATIITVASTYSANPHNTLTYTLLGDGASATYPGDDGVYLVELQIANTLGAGLPAGGITSDPFFFLLSKNADPSTVGAAAGYVAATHNLVPSSIQTLTAVPEPAALALHAGLPVLTLRRRR